MALFQALYKAAYSHEVKRDIYAECQNQFAQHMLEVHGENMQEHNHFGNWKKTLPETFLDVY